MYGLSPLWLEHALTLGLPFSRTKLCIRITRWFNSSEPHYDGNGVGHTGGYGFDEGMPRRRAIDSRHRGFAEGNGNLAKRASPSCLADGSFETRAKAAERGISIRCWVTMGGKKVRLLIHTLHTPRWPLLIKMIVRACRYSSSSSSPLTRGQDVLWPMSLRSLRSLEYLLFPETLSSYAPRAPRKM